MRRQEVIVKYAIVKNGRQAPALVAARGEKVVAAFLPGPSRRELVRRLRSRFPEAVEAAEVEVPGAAEVRKWLAGDASGLARVPVDLSGLPPFHRKVYAALRRVRPGKTVSYGELASRAGSPGAARAVGEAMRRNPLPPFVPCHRVLTSGGGLGGFTAEGGTALKRVLLEAEGWGGGGR